MPDQWWPHTQEEYRDALRAAESENARLKDDNARLRAEVVKLRSRARKERTNDD